MTRDTDVYPPENTQSYLQLDILHQPELKEGVLEIEPVVLPEGYLLKANNGHFGWPVAAKTDEGIVVMFHRKPHRWAIEGHSFPADEHTTRAAVAFSTDGCKTWSEPRGIQNSTEHPVAECRLRQLPFEGALLHAIAVLKA